MAAIRVGRDVLFVIDTYPLGTRRIEDDSREWHDPRPIASVTGIGLPQTTS
jgi:hypothetical protein